MLLYQARMERKQGFLFRCVDIVMELFAMAVAISHAQQLIDEGQVGAQQTAEMVDLFCRNGQRKVHRLFKDLWNNDDTLKDRLAARVIHGDYPVLAEGIQPLDLRPEDYAASLFREPNRAEEVREQSPS